MLLGELVNNLIDNALKYSEPGTPVRILLESDARLDPSCRRGPRDRDRAGRSCRALPALLRAEQARRRGIAGLGLGLAVAARLARAFGGDITATSRAGGGEPVRRQLAGDRARADPDPTDEEISAARAETAT